MGKDVAAMGNNRLVVVGKRRELGAELFHLRKRENPRSAGDNRETVHHTMRVH